VKDYLRHLVANAVDALAARNDVREALQAKILLALQRQGAMIPFALLGGSALRFLHGIERFSEDLDFSLERPEAGYELPSYLRGLRRDLEREGYSIEIKMNDQRVVHSVFVRFPGLPFELGLSAQRGEKLAVKLEIDSQPPVGAVVETSVVRRHETLRLQHHDRASLLAGKLHAILVRPYTKGRDLYDLLWYLSDRSWPGPNLELLNQALAQTGSTDLVLDSDNWHRKVAARLRRIDWRQAVADLRPFVSSSAGLDLISEEVLLELLTRRGSSG